MHLRWYLRRLSLMSPREIAYRARLFIGLRFREVFFSVRLPRPERRMAVRTPARLFPHLEDREKIVTIVARLYRWTPVRADRILAHEFSFFTFQRKSFGPEIQWNTDPLSGVTAPLRYGPAINYRDVALCGDIKYLWEPNRFLHLPELAKAYYLTGRPEYGDEVLRQIDSWVAACPYPRGANWASTLEVAIRLINWCITYEFLLCSPGDVLGRNADRHTRWRRSIGDHLQFLLKHRSRYSSANNHLIGELTGAFIGFLCFSGSGLHESLSALRDSLEAEAMRQHWPDGVNKEQAVRYQAFVFEFLLLAGIAGTRNGVSFSRQYWDVLRRSAEFVRSLRVQLGFMPALGDDDDGRVIALDDSPDVYGTMLAEAARLSGCSSGGSDNAEASEQAFWLLGDGPALVEDVRSAYVPRMVFPEGGLYLLKGGEATLLFDCGPLGYLSLAAHGHADALSILLSYKDVPFLVDSGTYAYHTHREWRDYFRGTFAHNTLRVDGQDQSVIGGNFMWLQKARARLLKAGPDFVAGSHDGYERLRDPVTHAREVRFDRDANAFIITDTLNAKASHTIDLTFTFSPDCRSSRDGEAVHLRNGGAAITLRADPALGEPRLLTGSTDPMGGWFSPGFDRKTAATTACWTGTMDGATRFVTRIQLEPM